MVPSRVSALVGDCGVQLVVECFSHQGVLASIPVALTLTLRVAIVACTELQACVSAPVDVLTDCFSFISSFIRIAFAT